MIKSVCAPLLFTLCFSLFTFPNASAQDTIKRVKILPVPTIGFSPETRTYLGAVTLFTFNLFNDSLTRTSNAKFEFNYTWNKQLILDTEWNYFFKEEKWFTKGKLQYSDYPDFYYGVGSNTPEINKLLFYSKRIVFEANILKKVGSKFFFGPNVRYINYYNVFYTGALTYPELTGSSTVGVGITLLKDTRDNLLTPEKGIYFNFNAGYNFSKSNYTQTTIDLRYYKTFAGKYTWANRLFSEFNFGTPAFYDYAFLGGDQFVRGYDYGRYRDKDLTSWQTEFRSPLIWRVGMAAFGGLSNLYNANNFNLENTKPNYGLGLRFLVDKHDKTNLRFDYAMGNGDNSGFYISFGESF
jgi:outer membrane protein assembly factor BamA